MALRERRMRVIHADFKKAKDNVLYKKKGGAPEGLCDSPIAPPRSPAALGAANGPGRPYEACLRRLYSNATR